VTPAPSTPRTRVGRPLRGFRLRLATARDTDLLVAHRRKMWEAIGGRSVADLDCADPVYRRWLLRELRRGNFLGFLVERARDRAVAGSGAIWLVPSQPRPGPLGRERMPYILSMFTDPAYRGRGVASRIVRAQVRWAEANGYSRIFLHASAMGRSVYAALGFVPGNEMRLDLPAGARSARRSRPGPLRPRAPP